MKNTKVLILKTSLILFNEKGLSNVTLRTIANKMNISQGNLNYHFKKRHEIIETLYFDLVENINKSFEDLPYTKNALEIIFDISNIVMKSFFEYRFFLLDFVHIMRSNEKIRNHYFELSLLRKKQFNELFQLLIEQELIRKEKINNEYANLYTRIQIVGDYWISAATTTHKNVTLDTVEEYSKIIRESLFPYLTKKGMKLYCKLFI